MPAGALRYAQESMSQPAYGHAREVAPVVAAHLARHRARMANGHPDGAAGAASLLPDAEAISQLVDAAFWASLRREEGYAPTISLAWLPPTADIHPLRFATPLPLDAGALAKLAPAVERPGIHLGVWPDGDRLAVWGTTRTIPPFCFVVEVVAPGLLVLKHRPRLESRKFVNLAVIEADRVKIVDEAASARDAECPSLLSSLLGFATAESAGETSHVLVQIAVSMRRHHRGGALLVVPPDQDRWRESIVQPLAYAVQPAFTELADLVAARAQADAMAPPDHDWTESVTRAVDALAGLTAVDGATIITDRYELLAFGAKIRRKQGGTPVESVLATEPIEGSRPEPTTPAQLGGTRHLSAAQFVSDQRDAVALVASQDGRFTLFAWSPCDEIVRAHRVDALLL